MNHSFTPGALDRTKCNICKYPLMAHGKHAQCEVCSNVGECNIFMTILMCATCEEKEKELQVESINGAEQRVEDYKKEVANVLSYYNARITPIAELKEIYELQGKTFQEFHARIKEQILHFSKVLFESQIEAKPDEISNLLIEFRAEVRTKIKERDINYVPPTKAPKVAKPKSALEKAAMNLVTVAASKGETITLIEAKARILKELGM